ncbi:MAG TPA: hypothetical protein VJQ45_01400 [Ktedonobacterales bacterium]|nr:hypothetical protein [Ktedonobacterales bacterium]
MADAGYDSDLVAMKVCTKCGPPAQPIENFAIRSRAKGTRQYVCRNCQNEYVRQHYQTHRAKYIEKARLRNAGVSRTTTAFVVEYLRHHPCVDCGESDIVVLEFDHLRDKFLEVSALCVGGYSLEAVKREIDKCEVVCANCHRRRTAKRAGSYRTRASG